jgi:hypothetical protein
LAVEADYATFDSSLIMFRNYLFLLLLTFSQLANGQRNYVPNSVLSQGDWFKIAIKKAGVYKVDFRFLKAMGMNMNGIASASIRCYGNGGQMLPESVKIDVADDLLENAIEVIDGGDGVFNDGDYFLFYGSGPHTWLIDSVNRRFSHQQNGYSDLSYYFITTGGTGRRIPSVAHPASPALEVNSYDDRYYYELDSLNLLSSGKNWYGPQMNAGTGQKNFRSFQLPLNELVAGTQALLVTNCVARSIGADSRFTVTINNAEIAQLNLAGVSASSYDVFARATQTAVSFQPLPPYTLNYQFTSGAFGAQGWIDWFEVFTRRKLVMPEDKTLLFRDGGSVQPGATARFTISKAGNGTQVWDISNPLSPIKMDGVESPGVFSFNNDCSVLKEYVAFESAFLTPDAIGKIKNQNLHRLGPSDYLIVTHPRFLAQAARLAAFHQTKNNLRTAVVNVDDIYNEFASGSPDPTAIRNFVKMFYDRAGADTTKRPRYLLLFGDASYDSKNRVAGNNNLIPPYESASSLDPLATYTSDDYFGFLDDDEDINDGNKLNLLDIGIGRIPAQTAAQARDYVDKVISYKDPGSLGRWRNELTFIADDEDFNLHLHDAETVTAAAAGVNPLFNYNKIYLDAYRQESNASGSRYPLVNREVEKKVETGSLILNYNGHGGFRRLAEEVVLDQGVLSSWNNPQRLPLFITATCDFAPYDNPSVFSLGEEMLVRRETGAIALMTTTRLVFAYSNRIINQQYMQVALSRKPDGRYRSLGEAVKETKNNTYQSFSDITNNRKFTLLGDPALTLNFPQHQVEVTEINGKTPGSIPDTLKAFSEVTVKGQVTDHQHNLMGSFNGTVEVTVFDKPEMRSTLANDPGSLKENFQLQEHMLFRGSSTVKDGRFTFNFLVPKDIKYHTGNGKISFYAENGSTDANGSFTGFIISGSLPAMADAEGPVMKGWLDNRQFLNGHTVSASPLLIVDIADSAGINLNNGNGHDMTAVLDGDSQNPVMLNDWLTLKKDSYRQGTVSFQLPRMAEGRHELVIKSWDNANNSSELQLVFYVRKETAILDEITNFPNPVTNVTRFCFTHKRQGEVLDVRINIFTLQGQHINTIHRTINTHSNRSCDIEWEASDGQGRKLLKGIYLYNIGIRGVDGATHNKTKKLIVM